MEIKEKLKNLLNCDKRIKLFVVLGFVGIILILLSELIPSPQAITDTKSKSNDFSYYEYIENLESKTETIVGSISGVGKCKVMITIKDSNEYIYAKNSEVSSSNGSNSKKYEYVFYDGSNGDEPIVIKQNMPEIQGVLIVCQGGDNIAVCSKIISAISSLYGVSSSKISISKLG